jgi:Raf kinase inhibitor-like YbhB/YbcL family protein
MLKLRLLILALGLTSWLIACGLPLNLSATPVPALAASPLPVTPSVFTTTEVNMSLGLTSPAFQQGSPIPVAYSCRGRDVSPALNWGESPAGTKSLALIMDDPDAPMGTWVHWVIYNIPASARGLPEAVPAGPQLKDGSLQGKNSGGQNGYNGPCPPSGTHRYFFKLYALDTALSLSSGANKDQLLKAMQGHILAQAELMGTFSK